MEIGTSKNSIAGVEEEKLNLGTVEGSSCAIIEIAKNGGPVGDVALQCIEGELRNALLEIQTGTVIETGGSLRNIQIVMDGLVSGCKYEQVFMRGLDN